MSNTIYNQFRSKVLATPDAIAVKDSAREVTYSQLDSLVDAILARFIKPDSRFIGIVMDHSIEMIAAILAVLKSGAAYVPAEPSFPIERIRYMMRECDVDFIITQEKYEIPFSFGGAFNTLLIDEIIDEGIIINEDKSTPSGLAYVLYTSGTTGTPKGVQVTNSNVCHYARAFANEFHPGAGDRMLQYSVCSFDIFVEEVFTTLLSGAALFIPNEATKNDILKLLRYISENKITIVSGFPYLLLEINKVAELLPSSLRLLISGGDVIRAKYITNLKDKVMIYNTYGPSETTVCASYFRVDNAEPLADGTFPIGKPVLGAGISILDEELKQVPDGEKGEICIFGDGVSNGYLGDNPENENFVVMDGRRFYRSGDLGYVLPDGNIAFLRRKDKQVMIMGKRIESDEVENLLITFKEVEDAVVAPYTDTEGLSYLVAYIIPRPDFDLCDLKRKLSLFLTPFMVPEFFISMPCFPMTPNGKVDRRMLPVPLKEGTL